MRMGLGAFAVGTAIRAFVFVFILKFVFGLFDVSSDLINGHNYLSGQYVLGQYFTSKTREDYLR